MKSASNKKIKAIIVVGARPNFMKAAPILRAMEKSGKFDPVLIHTGQHYDSMMSDVFFKDLDIVNPHLFLGVGSGTHGEQTARVLLAMEKHLLDSGRKPDLLIVVGDVNSTLAAALAAKKIGIPVAHVEAGLRSFDETMPEETNRKLTDHISDLLFTTEESGNENLKKEGMDPSKIHFVGNVMIDSLSQNLSKAEQSLILEKLGLRGKKYIVATIHRPDNVDDKENFSKIIKTFKKVQEKAPIVFPIHLRTRKQIGELGLSEEFRELSNVIATEPLGYLDFLKLVKNAALVITDSGGIQEETTYLGVPCVTLRKSTERPITTEIGTNTLLAELDVDNIPKEVIKILSGGAKNGQIPELWDGKAAERIVSIIAQKYGR